MQESEKGVTKFVINFLVKHAKAKEITENMTQKPREYNIKVKHSIH